MLMRVLPHVFLTLFLILGTACSVVKPDLPRLYKFETDQSTPPLVLIHGVFGSRLVDASGEERWPGGIGKIIWSDYQDIALEIDPATLTPKPSRLIVSGTTDRIAGLDYYGRIKAVLEQVGDYQYTRVGTKVTDKDRRYYVFEYDWRQDNVVSAQKLHQFLDGIRADYDQPDLKFDVVAHSMGGLVTRYFARYGSVDVLDDNDFPVNGVGASYLRRVAILGTPSLGSVVAVKNVVEGMRVGLNHIPAEVLLTFPSGYQLLPHPIVDWLVTNRGDSLDRDIFDSEFWRRMQLAIYDPEFLNAIRVDDETEQQLAGRFEVWKQYFYKSLERARRFVWSLTVPAEKVDTRYVVFGGDCHLTPNKLVVEEVNGDSELRLYPKDVTNKVAGIDYERLMLEPGDGTVTKASLLARQTTDPTVLRHKYSHFPLQYPIFLCEDHTKLTGNINFQDNLMHFLLSKDEF